MRSAALGYPIAFLLLAGCETTAVGVDPEAGADVDAGVDAPTDADGSSASDWCGYEWGSVLTRAAPGAEVLWSVVDRSSIPVPRLPIEPDRVEARTRVGTTHECSSSVGRYTCNSPEPFSSIVVTFAGQEWTFPDVCSYEEDPWDLVLDADCVAEGTTVLQGELLDYDRERAAAQVTLESPFQLVRGSTGLVGFGDQGYIVGTRCTVDGGHYACPTLGFSHSEKHTVVVGGIRREVTLPVADCTVEPVQLDIACPEQPEGLFVKAPSRRQFKVTASYEGGAPYPCDAVEALLVRTGSAPGQYRVRRPDRDYVCAPAPGNERGRGTYHIVAASSDGQQYEAEVSDAFDGCGGSPEPIVLTP
jgi:hypothetical protein